jgi:alkylated DNA repair dioxygenase AlkB
MFGIIKQFISEDFFNKLKKEINFRKDDIVVNNSLIKEERQTCWMSDLNYKYKYGNKTMNADELTPIVKKIQKIIESKYGKYFDSLLINYYSNGNIGMRYHSDETYGEWDEDTVVVSFGSTRKLVFREISNYENKTYFEVSSGDLIYMKEGCQQIYQHRVLKDKKNNKDRISLVFKKHKILNSLIYI